MVIKTQVNLTPLNRSRVTQLTTCRFALCMQVIGAQLCHRRLHSWHSISLSRLGNCAFPRLVLPFKPAIALSWTLHGAKLQLGPRILACAMQQVFASAEYDTSSLGRQVSCANFPEQVAQV